MFFFLIYIFIDAIIFTFNTQPPSIGILSYLFLLFAVVISYHLLLLTIRLSKTAIILKNKKIIISSNEIIFPWFDKLISSKIINKKIDEVDLIFFSEKNRPKKLLRNIHIMKNKKYLYKYYPLYFLYFVKKRFHPLNNSFVILTKDNFYFYPMIIFKDSDQMEEEIRNLLSNMKRS